MTVTHLLFRQGRAFAATESRANFDATFPGAGARCSSHLGARFGALAPLIEGAEFAVNGAGLGAARSG